MWPAFSSRTNRRDAAAVLFFLTASDMLHPYGCLTQKWSALDGVSVPRLLASILNETIMAGTVVLLLRCRTARRVPAGISGPFPGLLGSLAESWNAWLATQC